MSHHASPKPDPSARSCRTLQQGRHVSACGSLCIFVATERAAGSHFLFAPLVGVWSGVWSDNAGHSKSKHASLSSRSMPAADALWYIVEVQGTLAVSCSLARGWLSWPLWATSSLTVWWWWWRRPAPGDVVSLPLLRRLALADACGRKTICSCRTLGKVCMRFSAGQGHAER
ncbi:hypothetical protein LX36DRAFT_251930 [Colletotrichum falcatum]|nr:hypothetical protein LX36DRAFT_251930 [Colletotrichum falcatum]